MRFCERTSKSPIIPLSMLTLRDSCQELAYLAMDQSDYRKAMQTARAGIRVLEHSYPSVDAKGLRKIPNKYQVQFGAILSECFMRDPELRNESDQHSQGPIPF
jgi:hypothetical protein